MDEFDIFQMSCYQKDYTGTLQFQGSIIFIIVSINHKGYGLYLTLTLQANSALSVDYMHSGSKHSMVTSLQKQKKGLRKKGNFRSQGTKTSNHTFDGQGDIKQS